MSLRNRVLSRYQEFVQREVGYGESVHGQCREFHRDMLSLWLLRYGGVFVEPRDISLRLLSLIEDGEETTFSFEVEIGDNACFSE